MVEAAHRVKVSSIRRQICLDVANQMALNFFGSLRLRKV
jgi:hypothetical protein